MKNEHILRPRIRQFVAILAIIVTLMSVSAEASVLRWCLNILAKLTKSEPFASDKQVDQAWNNPKGISVEILRQLEEDLPLLYKNLNKGGNRSTFIQKSAFIITSFERSDIQKNTHDIIKNFILNIPITGVRTFLIEVLRQRSDRALESILEYVPAITQRMRDYVEKDNAPSLLTLSLVLKDIMQESMREESKEPPPSFSHTENHAGQFWNLWRDKLNACIQFKILSHDPSFERSPTMDVIWYYAEIYYRNRFQIDDKDSWGIKFDFNTFADLLGDYVVEQSPEEFTDFANYEYLQRKGIIIPPPSSQRIH